jgi:hypothetical protein
VFYAFLLKNKASFILKLSLTQTMLAKVKPISRLNSQLNTKCIVILLCLLSNVTAQVVRVGVKIGGQYDFVKVDQKRFKDTVKLAPGIGFNAGLVLSFKVRNRYFLHTEYLYSTKSKTITGKFDPDLKDKVTYHYFEAPILFTMHFKGQLGENRNFKWYLGAGPNIAYLLGGRGVISSGELEENGISSLSYKIKFTPRQDRDHIDEIHYTNVNRVQFGINIGAGALLEPIPKHKVMIDLRYTFDQTLFGKQKADYLVPHDYDDDLRFRNRGVRISLMYLLEYNISKKARNTGKSTIKKS